MSVSGLHASHARLRMGAYRDDNNAPPRSATTASEPAVEPPANWPPKDGLGSINSDDPAVVRAASILWATPTGRPIVDALREHQVRINVHDDADYRARFGSSGGIYLPLSNSIEIPRSATTGPLGPVTLLAHEGRHALDNHAAGGRGLIAVTRAGAGVLGALTAPLRLENPVTGGVNALQHHQNITEVNAFHDQSKVALELGMKPGEFDVLFEHGKVKPYSEIERIVNESDGYGFQGRERLPYAAMPAAVLGVGTAVATMGIARTVAPGTLLARNMLAQLAVGATAAGAMVLVDQVTHPERRPATEDATAAVKGVSPTGAALGGMPMSALLGYVRGAAITNAVFLLGPAKTLPPAKLRLAVGLASAAFSVWTSWNDREKNAAKLGEYRSLKHSTPKPIGQSVAIGALQGALVVGLGTALAFGGMRTLGSWAMGHSARQALKHGAGMAGQWLKVGAIGGAVAGAASGAIMRDPTTVWGSIGESVVNPASFARTLGFSALLSVAVGGAAYLKGGRNLGAAARAAIGTTLVATPIMYGLGTGSRAFSTGLMTTLGAPHRWDGAPAGDAQRAVPAQ